MESLAQAVSVDFMGIVLFVVENAQAMATAAALVVAVFLWKLGPAPVLRTAFKAALVAPVVFAVMMVIAVLCSRAAENPTGGLPEARPALEAYVETGVGDLAHILTDGTHAMSVDFSFSLYHFISQLLPMAFQMRVGHNAEHVPLAYQRGDELFVATLGESMVFTSGIYHTGTETLVEAQHAKLEYIATETGVKKGDKLMDIGCGWGRLAHHMASKHGAVVTGVTMSEDQAAFGRNLLKGETAEVVVSDYMLLDVKDESLDVVTSVEMAEHVGIRRYNAFIKKVHKSLKPGGTFYLQVAGLRRSWQWEDYVWGLFMHEHVFPGADASCPMGWVVSQLEAGGFEVQKSVNMGSHYSRTIQHWLEEWRSNQQAMSVRYGEAAYRRWEVFLAWSVRISKIGCSSLYMLTATRQGDVSTRIAHHDRIAAEMAVNTAPKA